MEARGPAEILGAILDEVEGLRRVDQKSHLPESLLREARATLEVGGPSGGRGAQLSSLDGLIDRTVSHVFEGELKRAQVVILCSDGSFIALETERDGDESYITVCSSPWGKPADIANYLQPCDLVDAGMMTKAEQLKIEREAKEAKIAAIKKSTEEQIKRLNDELARLDQKTV